MYLRPMRGAPGRYVSLTRSTRPGIAWQITYWDGDPQSAGAEPSGHIDVTGSVEDAAKEMIGMVDRMRANSPERAPGWVKRLLERRQRIEKAIGAPLGAMLGCGHFGCVFDSTEPWVVKLTIDPTEGDMWAALTEFQIESHYGTDGIARVHEVVRLKPDMSWRGKPRAVHAVLRERVFPIWGDEYAGYFSAVTLDRLGLTDLPPPGRFSHWSMEAVRPVSVRNDPSLPPRVRGNLQEFYSLMHGLLKYREAAEDWHRGATLKRAWNKERVQEAAWEDMLNAANRMSGWVGGYIGETLVSLMDRDIVLRDVHWENIAWRANDRIEGEELPLSLIIFDPGHSPTAQREIREVLVANRSPLDECMQTLLGEGLSVKKGLTEADVDPDELRRGIEVELEHTGDPRVAKRIALDHLAEHADYYAKLDTLGL